MIFAHARGFRTLILFLSGICLASICTLYATPVAAAVHEPEYDAVTNSALPRVLIIGDSISIGYTREVQRLLDDRFNVHRPAANCGATFIGLRDLSKWLADKKWDIIHFNFGLHDLRYCFDGDPYRMDDGNGNFPTAETGAPRTSLADYERNLRTIMEKLQATGAKLIWASTTPIGQYYRGYDPPLVEAYNAAAARVMLEMGVTINDLHAAAARELVTLQGPDHVHFNHHGQRRLGEAVARAIQNQMETDGKHLFILSGQSNMAGLRPAESFTPAVSREFGPGKMIVVRHAEGGAPIRRWDRAWKPAQGDEPEAEGDLYDTLMNAVEAAVKNHTIRTVTFIWMQGERDARESHGEVYAKSLRRLIDRIARDLGREEIHVVIGRLSDFDLENARYPHWTIVRDAQVEVAESHPRGAWINTDDLNDGLNRRGEPIQNDLHYSDDGYRMLGERFARAAIALINEK